jgi:hypothetical protein
VSAPRPCSRYSSSASLPHRASPLALTEGDVGIAYANEGVRDLVGVAVGAAQGQGLVVMVERLPVVAGTVVDESEAV